MFEEVREITVINVYSTYYSIEIKVKTQIYSKTVV